MAFEEFENRSLIAGRHFEIQVFVSLFVRSGDCNLFRLNRFVGFGCMHIGRHVFICKKKDNIYNNFYQRIRRALILVMRYPLHFVPHVILWSPLLSLFFSASGEDVRLMLWDTAGQEEFDAITKAYYRGAQACVIAFSTTDRNSFDAVKKWKRKVEDECGHIPMVLVQNKIDLLHESQVDK